MTGLILVLSFSCSSSPDDTGEPANQAPSVASVTITPPSYGQALSCSYEGFSDPEGDEDQSRIQWEINNTLSEQEGPVLEGPFQPWDEVLCRVTPSDGEADGEPIDSETVHTPCPDAGDESSESCVFIERSEAKAVPAHFSGFNVQLFHDGWQPWDERLVEWALALTPGTLRFPGGGSSYVYEWNTGDVPDDMINAFAGNDKKTDKFLSYQETVRGKGYLKLHDLSRLAQRTGARIVISINAMTDSAQDAKDFASAIIEEGVDVAVYELTNESMYWSHAGSNPRFWMGGYDYVSDMYDYFTKIEEAYENEDEIPIITISTSDGGETPNQALFDGLQLSDGYDGTEELGVAGYGSDWDPDATHEKYWEEWTHHWYPGRTRYQVDGVDYPIDAEDDEDLAAQIEDHWPIFLADLHYQLSENTTGLLEDYFLPLHGDPHWGEEAPPHFKANISEFNLRFTTPYTKSMFSAINAVESVLRWSREERVSKVGYHQLVGSCIGALDNHRQTAQSAHAWNGVIDSRDQDYGLFWHVPCLGVALVNRVVNTATVRFDTELKGIPTVSAAESIYDESIYRYVPQEEVLVDALFAQAYGGRDGSEHLLLTHRSEETRTLTVIVDGERLESGVSLKRLHHPDPLFENQGEASTDLTVEETEAVFPLEIGPYTVIHLDWTPPDSEGHPGIVEGLSASTAGDSVELSWTSLSGATGYHVKWGAAEGVYTFSQKTSDTELEVGPYQAGIDVFATVSAIADEVEGPNAPEIHHFTTPPPDAASSFDTDLSDWSEGCQSSDDWSLSGGVVSINAVTKHCLVHSQTQNTQRIRARFWMDSWAQSSENPRIGLVGRYVNEDQFLSAFLDLQAGKARIVRIREGAFEVIGRSLALDEDAALNLSNLGGQWVDLAFELDGQTLRFFAGINGEEHLLAAALDPDSEFDVGQAGLYTRKQSAQFDDFELR